jgi:hypothetical protein
MNPHPERREGERRRAPRQKSLLRGIIHYNNRRNAADCLIRDISPYGARLIFSDSFTTPDTLDLHIPQKDQTLRVHVIWRSAEECGVAFAQPATAAADQGQQGELAERVQRLEAEVASLKRILKRLKADVEGDVDAA